MLLQTKDIVITTQDGDEKTYIVSKIPAIPAREIVTQYPLSALPKVGDYKVNEAMMFKLISYAAVPTDAGPLALTTQALIHNHVPDFETLMKLEAALLEYNVSFFQNGKTSNFLDAIVPIVQAWITKISKVYSAQSSQKDAPPSTN